MQIDFPVLTWLTIIFAGPDDKNGQQVGVPSLLSSPTSHLLLPSPRALLEGSPTLPSQGPTLPSTPSSLATRSSREATPRSRSVASHQYIGLGDLLADPLP